MPQSLAFSSNLLLFFFRHASNFKLLVNARWSRKNRHFGGKFLLVLIVIIVIIVNFGEQLCNLLDTCSSFAHCCKRSRWWQICIISLGLGWKDTLWTDKVIKFLTNLSRLRCSYKVCVFFFLPYSFEVLSENCVKEGIMHSKETSIPWGFPLKYAIRLWFYVGIGY